MSPPTSQRRRRPSPAKRGLGEAGSPPPIPPPGVRASEKEADCRPRGGGAGTPGARGLRPARPERAKHRRGLGRGPHALPRSVPGRRCAARGPWKPGEAAAAAAAAAAAPAPACPASPRAAASYFLLFYSNLPTCVF
ncbi:uncharacterized protein LOC143273276 [Peromyscus maniculatus bairdii]|uniref:uncharacterized protein LOC143273276 n=1 Tax=Peromyscus maniculatus bairdii TaxID=230844 RepID=UPI003FD5B59A